MKNNKPHGLGKWEREDSYQTVEGEWKNGQLNGMVVENLFGVYDEYETKDGTYDGKFIKYYNDGSRI